MQKIAFLDFEKKPILKQWTEQHVCTANDAVSEITCTHRRRDSTQQLSSVGVGGVYEIRP